MSLVVVDTDVVSLLFKEKPQARLYESYLMSREPAISFMTGAELEAWFLVANWKQKRIDELAVFLLDFAFLPWVIDLSPLWAEIKYEARRAGRPIDSADAWIAATALYYDVPLVTNNASDFAGLSSVEIVTAKE